MAHRRSISRSSLAITFASRSRSFMPNSLSIPAITYPLLAIGKSRKSKLHCTTILVLFSLIAISTYIIFIARSPLALAPITLRADPSNNGKRIPADESPRSRPYRFPPSRHRKTQAIVLSERRQIQLDQSQELAAVTSFLASLPQNVIPSSVDPMRPIDPQLVLDFDTRSPRAADEMRAIVEDVWTQNPVVLFSKLRSPRSRELKNMIADLNLSPPPTIFDVDQREDANVLMRLLFRLTSSTDLPILLIGGKYVGTPSQIKEFHQNYSLHRTITDAGAIIDGAPPTKKGRK